MSKKILCLFTAALLSCAFLNTLTMGTAFPRVPLEMTPDVVDFLCKESCKVVGAVAGASGDITLASENG